MAFKNVMTTALLGVSAVNAHLIMSNPVPYGKDSLNNSPLEADGSDFPCKQRSGVYDVTKENTYSVGDSIPLSFKGSATHGGGSCQVSLTTDREPTKDSNWMVIKSIEGGCPINTEGNISGGENGEVPSNLNFTIPDGIDSGKYTMAWTWFNRVGNREMYMNCAPVTVQGGSSKRSDQTDAEAAAESQSANKKRAANFPGMFVANVNGCTTPESKDLRFPDPGEDVEMAGTPSNLMSEGEKSCSGTAKFGGGSGGSGGGSVSASVGVNIGGGGDAQATQSASSGGSFAADSGSSGSSSSSAPAAPAPTQEPASSGSDSGASDSGASASSAPSSDSSSSSSGSSSGSGSAKSGSCDQNGAWNCIDGSTYQRCASGKWTEAQQMAAGTECSPGEDAQNLSIKATLNARMSSEMRHRKRSLHHGAHHHA